MRVVLGLLLVGLTFGLVGCLQATMETDLAADGSGTFLMEYAMSPSVAETIKELEALEDSGAETGMPMLGDVDEDEIRKICKENGVTLTTFETTDTSMKIAGKFKNIEGLNAVMSEAVESDGSGGGLGLFKTEDGNYLLKMIPAAEGDDDDMASDEGEEEEGSEAGEAKEMDPAAMGKAMELMGKLMSSISELEMNMRFTVPGDVIESNAPKVEGRTSIWEINGDNIMAMENAGEPEILFSGEGLKIKAPALEP